MLMLRFTQRCPETGDPTRRAALYDTLLEMCAWGESHGALAAVISQHHGTDDGYLPSPVPVAAAIAARTSTLPVNVAALLLPFYEPVKLAEDLAVVDVLSHGRVSWVIGLGYRDEEFEMFGVDPAGRGARAETTIRLLRELWKGEPIDVDGRPVRVTPLPFTPGGPVLMGGGGTPFAAKRAARLGMAMLPDKADDDLIRIYNEEAERCGVEAPGVLASPPNTPFTVFVADDPDKAWAEVGEYMLSDAVAYGEWNAARGVVAAISQAQTIDELRAEQGAYQILTPDEARAQLAATGSIALQPLVSGLPPEIAWRYLENAAAVVAGQG
jgi:alkanesulfonate monooxygenase SsuD/methylene tetrahydromethanopterin reductase-like flavin-dependent oxidoreductase (luciferase family)